MIFKTINDNDSLSGQRIVSKFTARKIAQEEATKQLEIDIQCLRNYETECQKGSVSTENFSNTMKGASVEAQKYATNIKTELVRHKHLLQIREQFKLQCLKLLLFLKLLLLVLAFLKPH